MAVPVKRQRSGERKTWDGSPTQRVHKEYFQIVFCQKIINPFEPVVPTKTGFTAVPGHDHFSKKHVLRERRGIYALSRDKWPAM